MHHMLLKGSAASTEQVHKAAHEAAEFPQGMLEGLMEK